MINPTSLLGVRAYRTMASYMAALLYFFRQSASEPDRYGRWHRLWPQACSRSRGKKRPQCQPVLPVNKARQGQLRKHRYCRRVGGFRSERHVMARGVAL